MSAFRQNQFRGEVKTPTLDAHRSAEIAKAVEGVQHARSMRRTRVAAVMLAAGLVSVGVGAGVTTGCGASQTQVSQTESDAFKLAGCVLAQIFGGDTDPAAIGAQCVGALPAVIVDIIDDFSSHDAGAASIDVEHAKLLATARTNAVLALAKARTAK